MPPNTDNTISAKNFLESHHRRTGLLYLAALPISGMAIFSTIMLLGGPEYNLPESFLDMIMSVWLAGPAVLFICALGLLLTPVSGPDLLKKILIYFPLGYLIIAVGLIFSLDFLG
jgi:hypothetical protein